MRSDEVVADLELVSQELVRDDRAHRVAADVLRPGVAASVAKEAGHRVHATGLEGLAEHVELVGHEQILADTRERPGAGGRTLLTRQRSWSLSLVVSVLTCVLRAAD